MPKKKTIPDRREIIIIASFLQGETMAEIADSFGLSAERIRQILKRYGYKGKDGGSIYRINKRTHEIKTLTSQGFSMEEISQKVDLSIDNLKNYAKKEGIKLITNRGKMYREIKRLHDEGLNQNQISRVVNTPQSNVSRVLIEKYGTKRKKVEIDEVKKYRDLGYSVTEIADKLNAKPTNIYRILRQKLNTPRKTKVITKEIKDKIKELHIQGKNAKEISNELDVSINTIYHNWNYRR